MYTIDWESIQLMQTPVNFTRLILYHVIWWMWGQQVWLYVPFLITEQKKTELLIVCNPCVSVVYDAASLIICTVLNHRTLFFFKCEEKKKILFLKKKSFVWNFFDQKIKLHFVQIVYCKILTYITALSELIMENNAKRLELIKWEAIDNV